MVKVHVTAAVQHDSISQGLASRLIYPKHYLKMQSVQLSM